MTAQPTYHAFTADTPEPEAVARFVKRFGYKPQQIIHDPGPGLKLLRLGPVEPEKQQEELL